MLRVVAHKSAAAARQYYAEGLKREDYYSEKQEVVGQWHGKAAERLGILGDVTSEAFAALVENRHPVSGERLTPRTKADRRVGYDINFHAPKSLSVIQALTGDRRIVAAFREAVSETMAELEGRVGARIRKGGGKGMRATGNFAWAEFVHFTARPVGGVPDPHLHVHAFTFNCTFDEAEGRWKAAEFHDIKRDAPYAESSFHARLAGKVAALGWQVEHGKHGWEVAGVPREVIEKFSRRTAQIEAAAAERGIQDAKAKDALGAATREGKRKGLTNEDLRKEWKARLTREELSALRDVVRPPGGRKGTAAITPAEAVDHAFEKCFAKASVTRPDRLAGEALKFGMGQLTPAAIWEELGRREMILGEVDGELLCSTFENLAEEVRLIDFVRSGRGKCAPINREPLGIKDKALSAEQRRAAEGILGSTSQVIMVRGAAGVGKTTLMKAVVPHIEATGLRVFAFAQSASASRGTLRDEGFEGANTIAHLLSNKDLQRQVRGQVIWIDEAGLVGLHDIWRVMQVAGPGTRIILTGDQYQHGPVARGDPFRIIQHYAGIPVIEVTQIRRQEREIYRQAVTALSRGNLPSAFRKLEELGAFVELEDDGERHRRLAADYLKLGRRGMFPLVVSPTHAEAGHVTEAIREARKAAGQLKGEREFVRYRDLRWDDADKRRPGLYREGLVVQFNQNARGIVRGSMLRVTGTKDGVVTAVDSKGVKHALPLQQPGRFQIFQQERVKFATGDRIRLTMNGKSSNGKRLDNGDLCTIEKIRKNGTLVLSNGAELKAGHGHWTHGYCATSHSSQSRSVKDVLVAQGSKSFVASSCEQFYVSVSRGKQTVRIYTDDLPGLKEAVGISSSRLSGVELAGLNSKDVSQMSAAMGSKEWRDYVRSRSRPRQGEYAAKEEKPGRWRDRLKSRAVDDKGTHRKNLRSERKGSQPRKGGGMSWQNYVRMRRQNAGADGKSRSLGRGSAHSPGPKSPEARLKELQRKGETKLEAPAKKAAPRCKKPDAKASKSAARAKSSAKHFRKVSAGRKQPKKPGPGKDSRKKGLKPARPGQVAKRKERARKLSAGKNRRRTAAKAKQKTPAVRPPTPRK